VADERQSRFSVFLIPAAEPAPAPLRAVLFDFGGVLAEEGFREGLHAIARSQGLDPATVHRAGMEAVYASGYVLGRGSEADFWRMVRQRTGVQGEDAELSAEILSRFVVRPRMLAAVRALRKNGYLVAILSDQTDWLERLDARDHFFAEFDRVFNSYRLGTGKLYPDVFTEVVSLLGVRPQETLFVDDLAGNIERAAAQGLRTLHGEDEEYLLGELERLCGVDAGAGSAHIQARE
jgi:putative hydrolase of the HAD superfamily